MLNLQLISSLIYLSCTDKQYLLYSYLTIIAFNFLPYEFIVFSTSAANIGLFASSVPSNASDKLSTSINIILSLIEYKSLKLLTSLKYTIYFCLIYGLFSLLILVAYML